MADADKVDEGLNWRVAGGASVLGLAAVAVGLYLGDFTKAAYSALLIELGAAIGLVAVLALLERRLIARTRTVTETAARSAVKEVADALEDRLVRLEELDEAQQRSREGRRRRAESVTDAVRTQGLNAMKVGDLLASAVADGLFADEEGIRVRTSEDPNCPLLYVLVLAFPNRQWIFLDFEPILYSGQDIEGVPMPNQTATMVLWDDEESAGQIAGLLEASLERRNVPIDTFSFQYALDRLVRSVEVMRAARAAPSGSPLRLEGRLRLLVNDEWALTDWGLESVSTAERFKSNYGTAFRGDGGGPFKYLFGIIVPVETTTSPSLDIALTWLKERERLLIDPPDDQEHMPRRF